MRFGLYLVLACLVATVHPSRAQTSKETVLQGTPLGVRVSVKMIGPYAQATDLQIICLFKHKDSGDTYQGAAKDTNDHLGGLLSSLRNRCEFVGELGETILFTPPKGSIPAKRFMVIGLGDEQALTLDALRVVGRVAAREAVRLKARNVAWAPVIRDEGNTLLDVGDCDRAFVEQLLAAYNTERRLQSQGLADKFSIERVVIEAGPTFFDSAVKQVSAGIDSITEEIGKRDTGPYSSIGK
jgi:hypothetical protein